MARRLDGCFTGFTARIVHMGLIMAKRPYTRLSDKQEELLEKIADNADDIEADVEENAQRHKEIMHAVMTDPSAQDQRLFEAKGLPVGLTIQDLVDVPIIERTEEWKFLFKTLVAVAEFQAWAMLFGTDHIELAEKHHNEVQRLEEPMSRQDLAQASKEGVESVRRSEAKSRRAIRRVGNG